MSADYSQDDNTDWRAERLSHAFRVAAISDTSLMGNRFIGEKWRGFVRQSAFNAFEEMNGPVWHIDQRPLKRRLSYDDGSMLRSYTIMTEVFWVGVDIILDYLFQETLRLDNAPKRRIFKMFQNLGNLSNNKILRKRPAIQLLFTYYIDVKSFWPMTSIARRFPLIASYVS